MAQSLGEEAKERTISRSSSMLNDEPMDLDALSALDQLATKYIEYSKAMEGAGFAPPPPVPQAQRHRRKSRAECKIAALQRGDRGDRSNHQKPSPRAKSTSLFPSEIPEPIDVGDAVACYPQSQQLLPSPPSLIAFCYNCNHQIADFQDTPYNLPTSCPTCEHPLTYRPFKEEKPPLTPKTKSRFRHLPLDQRAAAQEALKKAANAGIDPKPSMGPALETTSAGELKQGGEQRKKRRWTMNEKKSAKAAKKGSGSETGEEAAAAAVRVDSEATEDEDEVVFVKEVVHVQQGKMSKTCNEKRREWAAEHRDTLPERSSLNSKARRQIRRQIKAAGRDLDA